MACSYCGSALHTATHCPKTWGGYGNRQKMRCSYCGSNNHYRDACPKTVAPHNRKPDRYVRD